MYRRYKWKWRICQKDGKLQELFGQRLSGVHYFEKSKGCSQVTVWCLAYVLRGIDLWVWGHAETFPVLDRFGGGEKEGGADRFPCSLGTSLPTVFHSAFASCFRGQELDKSLELPVFLPVAYFSVWGLWSSEVDIYSCTWLFSLEGVLPWVQDESTACIL